MNKNKLKMAAGILSLGVVFFIVYQLSFSLTFGKVMLDQGGNRTVGTNLGTSSAGSKVAAVNQKSSTPNFTKAELAKYNGMNGQSAYIATDGVVYDMTKIVSWKNGQHHGLSAGQDLTKDFASSPHLKIILNIAKVVGTYGVLPTQNSTTVNAIETPVVSTVSTTVGMDTKTTASLKQPVAATAGSKGATAAVVNLGLSKTGTATKGTTWTLVTLAQYNGKNGQAAYIAVNGIIYDVTTIGAWQNGVHHGIKAGQDATANFASSPHTASLLKKMPIVGKLGDIMNTNSPMSVATTAGSSAVIASTNNLTGKEYSSEKDDQNFENDKDEQEDHDFENEVDEHDDYDFENEMDD